LYNFSGNQPRIEVLDSVTGATIKSFAVAPHGTSYHYDYSTLHWNPDGRELTYPLLEGNVASSSQSLTIDSLAFVLVSHHGGTKFSLPLFRSTD
jgi:hypothetical protein